MSRTWYAVIDPNHKEWDRGSTNFKEAEKMAVEIGSEAQIAIIKYGFRNDVLSQTCNGWADQFGVLFKRRKFKRLRTFEVVLTETADYCCVVSAETEEEAARKAMSSCRGLYLRIPNASRVELKSSKLLNREQ